MDKKVVVVNTHPGANPEFVGKLTVFLASVGAAHDVIDGYDGPNPLGLNAAVSSRPECL